MCIDINIHLSLAWLNSYFLWYSFPNWVITAIYSVKPICGCIHLLFVHVKLLLNKLPLLSNLFISLEPLWILISLNVVKTQRIRLSHLLVHLITILHIFLLSEICANVVIGHVLVQSRFLGAVFVELCMFWLDMARLCWIALKTFLKLNSLRLIGQ